MKKTLLLTLSALTFVSALAASACPLNMDRNSKTAVVASSSVVKTLTNGQSTK